MKYLLGKDYPDLCTTCQAAITACAEVVAVGPDVTVTGVRKDDNEAPLMFAGDHKMLCGGHTCAEREKREREAEVWRVHASVRKGVERPSFLWDEDFETYREALDRARVVAGDKAGDIDGKVHTFRYSSFAVYNDEVDEAFYYDVQLVA